MNHTLGSDVYGNSGLAGELPLPAVDTCFAPAGRDSAAEVARQAAAVAGVPLLAEVFDALPDMVAVLNIQRQIVAANRRFLEMLGASVAEVVEKRPGEAIRCIRAQEGPDGCGTGLHCATCGAVNAIMDSLHKATTCMRECRILVRAAGQVLPLDLRVTAAPLAVAGHSFVLVTIADISNEKRVAVLQRTFFHDVLNTAGCIHGYTQFLATDAPSDAGICNRLVVLAERLIEEIEAQRDLLHAESGDLELRPVPLRGRQVLEELCDHYRNHPAAAGCSIAVGPTWDGAVLADQRLLRRVLSNMLKNALEAAPPESVVTLACTDCGAAVGFTVHNSGVMPQDVQLQVFQRSFSTKGQPGRGIGTYSMKLLGERYLGGVVDFVSHPPEGTTFRLLLPKGPSATVFG